MARNRLIKVDFWADEKIGQLTSDEKLLFIGMWTFADDVGVVRANTAYLKANIFPYDEKITAKKLDTMLQKIKNIGLILSGEHGGESFFLVKNFLKHQTINRPSPFRFIPDSNKHNVLELFHSLSAHGVLTEDSVMKVKEKVKVNVKEKVKVKADFDFEALYKKYPRKEGKERGLEKCQKTIKTQEEYENLSRAIDNYADMCKDREKKYIKHFSTFMNEDWKDYIKIQQEERMSETDKYWATFYRDNPEELKKRGYLKDDDDSC